MADTACSMVHPTKGEVFCNRPISNQHENHSGFCLDEDRYVSWPNEDYKPSPVQIKAQQKREADAANTEQKRKLRALAERIRGAARP